MENIVLYMAPGTCARVPCILLEEIGVDFQTRVIRFMRGEHKSPEFKLINPKGKVPALQIDGVNLTENVAIISYLRERFPEANLMPVVNDLFNKTQQIADLCYCASTLHPIVSRIRLPHFFALEEASRSVWLKACEAMDEHFDLVDKRLTNNWWYGEQWSAMDAYLYWIFWRVEGAGYDVSRFANFVQHRTRSEQRPAIQKALAREQAAQTLLEKEGLAFTPPSMK